MKKFLLSFSTIAVTFILTSCKHEAIDTCNTSAFAYAADIKPIMDARCSTCHKASYTGENGGLYLDSWADLNDYVINNPENFMGSIKHVAGYEPMPEGGSKLSDCEIKKLQNWIDAGAPNN